MITALLVLACNGESVSTPDPVAANIIPAAPTRLDTLRAVVDSGQDRTSFGWYLNGTMVATGQQVRPGQWVKGDRVSLRVPLDADTDADAVVIANSPPEVSPLTIDRSLEYLDGVVSCAIQVTDADEEPVEVQVTWWRNGEVFSQGPAQQEGDRWSSTLTLGFDADGAELRCAMKVGDGDAVVDRIGLAWRAERIPDYRLIHMHPNGPFPTGCREDMAYPPYWPGADDPPASAELTHDFWYSAIEVTDALWRKLDGVEAPFRDNCPDCAVSAPRWSAAAMYLNELSRRAGLTPCYVCSVDERNGLMSCDGNGNPYRCEGFRMPTDAEYYFASYAGGAAYGDMPNGAMIVDAEDPDIPCPRPLTSDGTRYEDWAWYCRDSPFYQLDNFGPTHPVAEKFPNVLGVYDIIGNALEYSHDPKYANGPLSGVDPLRISLTNSSTHFTQSRGGTIGGGRFMRICDSKTYDVPASFRVVRSILNFVEAP